MGRLLTSLDPLPEEGFPTYIKWRSQEPRKHRGVFEVWVGILVDDWNTLPAQLRGEDERGEEDPYPSQILAPGELFYRGILGEGYGVELEPQSYITWRGLGVTVFRALEEDMHNGRFNLALIADAISRVRRLLEPLLQECGEGAWGCGKTGVYYSVYEVGRR